MLLNLQLFFGHLHPLLVHLPIGFLLLAVLFEWTSRLDSYSGLRMAVPFTLLLGMISALAACLTGWILSGSGGYDEPTLALHKWMGLSIPLVSFFAWRISTRKQTAPFMQRNLLGFVLLGLVVILSIAGHIGASLTHGAGYLSASTLFDTPRDRKPPASLHDALVFEDLIQPILDKKCGQCHNNSKMKGRLSLENWESVMKGGKHGPVLLAGQPAASELIKRISLDPHDDKFMPSDGKPPLTPEEGMLLKWWIEQAAGNAAKKWGDLPATAIPAPVDSYAKSVFKHLVKPGAGPAAPLFETDSIKAPAVDPQILADLRKAGFMVKTICLAPVLLDVTLPAKPVRNTAAHARLSPAASASRPDTALLKKLLPVKENIVWLNISGNNLSDDQMDIVARCSNLQRLRLDRNPLTDKALEKLHGLRRVESINLYNTQITKNCLPGLSAMSSLRTICVWGTSIKKEDLSLTDSARLRVIL